MSPDLTRRGFLVVAGLAGVAASGATRAPRAAAAPEPDALYYYRRLIRRPQRVVNADVCVYGATSSGVVAAVQAAQLGRSVALVSFGRHVGGVTSGGLGATDVGNSAAIGGLSRQFYERVGAHYGTSAKFAFEPHVAEQVFDDWLAEAGVTVYREEHLHEVHRQGGVIREIVMESGLTFRTAAYVDATYEGDLMARAGVTYTIGREDNAIYGETWDGYHVSTNHQFRVPIDPYLTPGDPTSGLLPGISAAAPATTGAGDRRIQAYNFRLCLTRAADRLPFPRPPGYDPARYELLRRYLQAGIFDVFGNNQTMPNGKSDLNNNGAVATDNIGAADGWPEGDYHEREIIFQDHVDYQQGLLYFLANDPGVPANVRTGVSGWGLPRDEFTDTGGWSHELYVREGRRMVSDYVMTEHNCLGRVVAADSIGLASYTMDSHNCERIVIDGHPSNEGNIEVSVPAPYPLSYQAMVPRAGECTNLLVPVALSASHIGYGSVRMEPVFMILGHAAGTAAAQAVVAQADVQRVDYTAVRAQLLADGALLEWPPPAGPLTVSADHAVAAGGILTAITALRNTTTAPLPDVTLSLAADGWGVAATSPTAFPNIAPGDGVAATWQATAPVSNAPLARSVLHAAGAGYSADATVYVESAVAAPYRTFAGTESYFGQRDNQLAIAAAGADLWTTIDAYGAIYLPGAAGPNAVLTVKVASQDATNPNARAGLMLRDDVTEPGRAPGYVVLAVKPQNGFLLLWDADGNGYVESVARADTGTTPYPAWLRLERNGTTATGSYSTDGTIWHVIGQATVPAAAAQQDAAVFVTSHDPTIGLVAFEDFAVT